MVDTILLAGSWFLFGFVLGIAFTKFCRYMSRKIRRERLMNLVDSPYPDDPEVKPWFPPSGMSRREGSFGSDRYLEVDNQGRVLVDRDEHVCSRDPLCLEREREDRF